MNIEFAMNLRDELQSEIDTLEEQLDVKNTEFDALCQDGHDGAELLLAGSTFVSDTLFFAPDDGSLFGDKTDLSEETIDHPDDVSDFATAEVFDFLH